MKKVNLKRMLAVGLAVTALVSSMSITAMAKDTMELESGIVLEMYNSKAEKVPSVSLTRDVDFDFEFDIPVYPNFVYLQSKSGMRNLELDSGQSVIQISFDKSNRFKYFSIYDVTIGEYIEGSSNEMIEISEITNDVFRFRGLTGGHTYRIGLAHTIRQTDVTGTVISY